MTLGAAGLLVLGGILGALAVTAIPALAAGRGDAANTTLVGDTTNPSASGYCALYEQTLAAKLGVSVSTLESDNIAAIDAVINQAVKDGKITQAQATQIEQNVAANGTNVCSHIGAFLGKHHRGGRFGVFGAALSQVRADVQAAVAKKLGYADAAHLHSALMGTDIVSLAKSKGVDQATLNATIKAAVQSDLNSLVSKGTITSAQETQALTMVTNLLNAGRYGVFGLGGGHPGASA